MYAYFTMTKLHWPVSRFANLPPKEKAMTIAMIDEYIKRRKEAENAPKGRR